MIGVYHFIDAFDLLSLPYVFSLRDSLVKQMVFSVLFFQLFYHSIAEGLNNVHFA